MYAEKLLVHDSRQRQRTEGLHACLVDLLRVFVLALQLEGEVVCQMPTFVVASQEPKCIGVPYLQSPEIEHALAVISSALLKVSLVAIPQC